MYAVVDLQGHQYIVSEKDEIVVDNVDLAQWKSLVADKVLAIFDEKGDSVKVWTPYVDGASVEFNVGETQKGERKLKFLNLRERQDMLDWKGLDLFRRF